MTQTTGSGFGDASTNGHGRWSTDDEQRIADEQDYLRIKGEAKLRYEKEKTEAGMFGEQGDDDLFARGYVNVAALLAGGIESPVPKLLARTDGQFLFYRGEVNTLFGDPDSGKTWIMLCGCAEVLASGGRV